MGGVGAGGGACWPDAGLDGHRPGLVGGVAVEDAETLESLVQELVDWRLMRYLDGKSTAGSEFRLKVIRAGEKSIIMLDRAKNPGLPEGRGVPVIADGQRYTFDFMKVAVNVARLDHSGGNVLRDLLTGWFGETAGQPGTDFRVLLREDAGNWVAEPERREGVVQGLEQA